MVMKKLCSNLLEERDLACKAILKENEAQCREINNRFLEQKDFHQAYIMSSNLAILEQKDFQLLQMRNYTQNLAHEKDIRLETLQRNMNSQQLLFGALALIATAIIFSLIVVASNLFVGQEKEKAKMNEKYESIIQEKSDRILQLEKQSKEQEAQRKKEQEAQRKKQEVSATAHQMISPHPMIYALPSMMGSATSPEIKVVHS